MGLGATLRKGKNRQASCIMSALPLEYKFPSWLNDFRQALGPCCDVSPQGLMKIAVELSRLSVSNRTGGPFGAVVADVKNKKIVGFGVNSVLHQSSVFHAEIVAIWDAQSLVQRYTLEPTPEAEFWLASSSAPCAMCTGALVWSGIKTLVSGATTRDVEETIGFDEGPLHPSLLRELHARGISVISEIMQIEARAVLRQYLESGGVNYGPRKGQ